MGGEKQCEIEGKVKETFRIYFSSGIPHLGAKIMPDCSICFLYALIASTLIRLQFHSFLGVVTVSFNIFLKLALSWIPCCVGPKPVVLRTGKVRVTGHYPFEGDLLTFPGWKESKVIDFSPSGQLVSLRDKPYWGCKLVSVARRWSFRDSNKLD